MALNGRWFLWTAASVSCLSCDAFTDNDADNGDISGSTSCDATDGDELAELECDVFDLVNDHRTEGADCGSEGSFAPTNPLRLQPVLTEASRLHSLDMGENDFFSHTNLHGEDVVDRIEALGYTDWSLVGENIAAGDGTAQGVMNGWMNSDGHCANIMQSGFTQIGIGIAEVPGSKYKYFWTQVFATPN